MTSPPVPPAADAPTARGREPPLLALGFRPFYLLASAFAAVSILLWVGAYAGVLPGVYGRDPVWHAHEMVYGFASAVIVGFLFTAGRNWSGQPTPSGRPLLWLCLLWLGGRVLVLTPWMLVSAVVNAAFPIAAALMLGIALARGDNRRNYFFVVLLLLLGVVELAIQLAQAGILLLPVRAGLQVALDVILFIVAVMAGRVVPMFTNNGIPGAQARRLPWIERLALGSVLALIACDVAQVPPALVILVLAVAALAHAVRLWAWQPWRTVRTPLVWILHAGYAWLVVHFVLRALAEGGYVPGTLATHALTVGVIGSFTIGMMTRTAKGHTGRPLAATSAEVAVYALVEAAAIVRVLGGLLLPAHYVATVAISGLCFAAAFAWYAILYWPVLSRPRLDGKPG